MNLIQLVRQPRYGLTSLVLVVFSAVTFAYTKGIFQNGSFQWMPSKSQATRWEFDGTRQLGEWDISGNFGELNYKVRLPVLPQRGDAHANFYLAYTQGSERSAWGEKWQLPISSIVQTSEIGIPGPRENPGEAFGAQLMLDGQRLFYVGTSTTHPITKVENHDELVKDYAIEKSQQAEQIHYFDRPFSISVLMEGKSEQQMEFPTGFVVSKPDGSQLVFTGHKDEAEGVFDSTQAIPHVTRWPLKLIRYPGGNAIVYDYNKVGGISYLAAISMAGNRSRYIFETCEVDDANCALKSSYIDYSMGFPRQHRVLYTRILAQFDKVTEETWCMVYSQERELYAAPDCAMNLKSVQALLPRSASAQQTPVLRAILRLGAHTNAQVLHMEKEPALVFHYHRDTFELAATPLSLPLDDKARILSGYLIDLNSDGRVDLIEKDRRGDVTFSLAKPDAEGTFLEPTPWVLTREDGSGASPYFRDDDFQLVDLDGDGWMDVVEISRSGTLEWYQGSSSMRFHRGSTLYSTNGQKLYVDPSGFKDRTVQFLDYDNDRAADLLLAVPGEARDTVDLIVYKNLFKRKGRNRLDFEPRESFRLPLRGSSSDIMSKFYKDEWRYLDVNADGLQDLVENINEPDFQGLCVYPNSGRDWLFFGMEGGDDHCQKLGYFSKFDAAEPGHGLGKLWLLDVNSDGRPDLLDYSDSLSAEGGSMLLVYFNKQDGFHFGEPQILDLGSNTLPYIEPERVNVRVNDIDGDGLAELIVVNSAANSEQGVAVNFAKAIGKEGVMESYLAQNPLIRVVSSNGTRAEFQYLESNREGRDDPNFARLPSHSPLIKQVKHGLDGKEWDEAGYSVTRINYGEPQYDLYYGAFAGFGQIERLTANFGIKHADAHGIVVQRELYHGLNSEHVDSKVAHLCSHLKEDKVYRWKVASEVNELLFKSANFGHFQSDWQVKIPAESSPDLQLKSLNTYEWQVADGQRHTRSYLRLSGSKEKIFEEPIAGLGGSTFREASATFVKFDAFNIPQCHVVERSKIVGPKDTAVPPFIQLNCVDYTESRKALKPLGIIDAPHRSCTAMLDKISETENSCLAPQVLAGVTVTELNIFEYDGKFGKPTKHTREVQRVPQLPKLLGDVTLVLASENRVTQSSYDQVFGNLVEARDSVGSIFTRRYDDVSGVQLLAETNALGHETLYCYGQNSALCLDTPSGVTDDRETRSSLLTHMRNPQGLWTHYSYDEAARPSKVRLSSGESELYCYDDGDKDHAYQILVLKNPSVDFCKKTSSALGSLLSYDAFGNLKYQADALDGGGLLFHNVASYFPQLKLRRSLYDTTRLSDAILFDYYAASESDLNISDSIGLTTYEFDEQGRFVSSSHPNGMIKGVSYQAWGKVFTESAGSTVYQAIADDLVYATIDSSGPVRRVERGPDLKIRTMTTTGEPLPRLYIHNSFGELVYSQIPGFGASGWLRDPRGKVLQQFRWNTKGQLEPILVYEYDALNRLTRTSVEDPVTRNRELISMFAFDKSKLSKDPYSKSSLGQLTSAYRRDEHGLDSNMSFEYDQHGRLLQQRSQVGILETLDQFAYGPHGGMTSVRSSNPLKPDKLFMQSYTLGAEGYLKSVDMQTAESSELSAIVRNIDYDDTGKIKSLAYGNGLIVSYSYDNGGQLATLSTTDAAGVLWQKTNIKRDKRSLPYQLLDESGLKDRMSGDADFVFDARKNLISSQQYGRDFTYAYGSSGVLEVNSELSPLPLKMAASETSEEHSPLLMTPQEGSIKYDSLGRLLESMDLSKFRYDVFGNLISVTAKSQDVQFGYSALGERTYKRLDNGRIVYYLSPYTQVIQGDPDLQRNGTRHSIWIFGKNVVSYFPEAQDWHLTLFDGFGSAEFVVDKRGDLLEELAFTPLGQEIDVQAGDSFNERRFQNEVFDAETGLYYLQGRFYYPKLGQFITPDGNDFGADESCMDDLNSCSFVAKRYN